MRVVKLSKDEFSTIQRVQDFFSKEIPRREPPGKFRVPKGWIAPKKFSESERLLFQYDAIIIKSSTSKSKLMENLQDPDKYPVYFAINLNKIKEHCVSIYEMNSRFGSKIKGQAWNIIPDPPASDIWDFLQGEPLAK